jgi:hypothetical protein
MDLINLQITELSQLVFLVFFFFCAFFIIWCVITSIGDFNKFRLRLSDLDIDFKAERISIPARRDLVNRLKRWLPPRKRLHQNLTDYAFDLRRVVREIEEQEESKRREEEEASGQIKMRDWDS